MSANRLLNLVRNAAACVMVGGMLGQAPAIAQADSAPTAQPATAPAAVQPAEQPSASGASQPATTPSPGANALPSKPKHRRLFAAWLHADYDDRAKNAPASEAELVKDADDYNHRRQWVDDCPVDEFIITPGGGS